MKPGHDADKVYLTHMLECIKRIEDYTDSSEDRFRESRLIQDAVVRNLQTLAESSQRLTDEIRSTEDHIAWRAIAGFRNILVHDYLAIDADAVWLVVSDELPKLKAAS